MPRRAHHCECNVDIGTPQIKKLCCGQNVQLKPHQIGAGNVTLKIGAAKHKKLHKAKAAGKQTRLSLNQAEITGSGLGDFFRKLARGWKQNVVPVVGEEIRKGLTGVAQAGIPIAATYLGGPEAGIAAGYLANKFARKAVDWVGNTTGAFGLGKHRHHLKSDSSPLMGRNHPSQSQPLLVEDHSMARYLPTRSGGSFSAIGG